MKTYKVVILAAGKGTRLGLNSNKCSVNLRSDGGFETTISRLINQINDYNGYNNFNIEIYVVLGFDSTSVVKSIECGCKWPNNVCYLYNPYYEEFGCNYSLSLSSGFINNDPLLVLEADNFFSHNNIRKIMSSSMDNSKQSFILVRSGSYLNTKSVQISVDENETVCKLYYDQNHKTEFDCNNPRTFDSMQAFFVGSQMSKELSHYLYRYRSKEVFNHKLIKISSIYTLDNLIKSSKYKFSIIKSDDPMGWINLNDMNDLLKIQYFIMKGCI